jgi:prepilin-type N-terminal cleavage/methylation domain-containing protein
MKPRHRNRKGFSLIELMFAMAIGSITLILAGSLLNTAGTTYQRITETVSAENEARCLIDQLTADLATAIPHAETLIERSTASWPTDHLGLLFTQPPEAQDRTALIGDLCSVNYYLKDLKIGDQTIRCLMRGVTESRDTFIALREKSISSLFAPRLHLDEPVAFGVLSFVARPMTRNEQGKWIDFHETESQQLEALEVRLILARRNLIPKLKIPEDWNGIGQAETLLGDPLTPETNKNLKVFSILLKFGHESKF